MAKRQACRAAESNPLLVCSSPSPPSLPEPIALHSDTNSDNSLPASFAITLDLETSPVRAAISAWSTRAPTRCDLAFSPHLGGRAPSSKTRLIDIVADSTALSSTFSALGEYFALVRSRLASKSENCCSQPLGSISGSGSPTRRKRELVRRKMRVLAT